MAQPEFVAPPSPLPDTVTEYHHFWRRPYVATWRIIVMLVALPIAFLLTSMVAVIGAAIVVALRGGDVMQMLTDAGNMKLGPEILVANSAGIGLLVPVCLLIAWISGQRPRYLSSVAGGFRWRYAVVWSLIVTVFVAISMVVMTVVAPAGASDMGELAVREETWVLLILLLLITPFQAAGEEYLLRGVAFRGIASFFPWAKVGLVVSALITSAIFMLIHGAADPWLNLTYFVMGLLFAYVTWRTGGIEAAVALHVGNNMIGMGVVPFTDYTTLFDRGVGAADWTVLIQVAFLILATVVIEWMARKKGLVRASAPAATPPKVEKMGRRSIAT